MTDAPRYGQRAPQARQEMCTKHPGVPAVSYCKRCNRPACADCSIQTEVGAICTDCAARVNRSGYSTGRPANSGSPWSNQRARAASSAAVNPPDPVTMTLIGINVVLLILQTIWPQVTNWLAFNPVLAHSQPWRLITAAFVHGGFIHLLFNMMMLYSIGTPIEKVLGWWRYLAIYLLSALGGSMMIIGWVLVQPQSAATWTVGASGAIYGLLGAILILQKRAGMSTTSIMVLLGVNLFYSFTMSGISWQAHVGGFLMGLISTAAFFWAWEKAQPKGQKAMTTYGVVTLAVLALAALGGTAGLYLALGL